MISHRMISHHGPVRRAAAPSVTSQVGATLVEMALLVPVLILLVAGTLDLGLAWRSGIAAATATRAGARVGSSLGNDNQADVSILTTLKASLSSAGLLSAVTWVIIYQSTDTSGALPAACLAGTASSGCVRVSGANFRAMLDTYTSSQFTTYFNTNGCLKVASPANWCPTSRNTIQYTADYLGVYVQLSRSYVFPQMGSALTIKRNAVMRLEPPG
jgi:Flp pilus assembly protein TadG